MDRDIKKQIKQLNQKLRSVFEEQDRNQSALRTQEQAEADFHELKNRSKVSRKIKVYHGQRTVEGEICED